MSGLLDGARWRIINDDCANVLSACADNEFAALVTDPPYGIGEAAGKNGSRGNLAVAKDYGSDEWDNKPPSSDLLTNCRRVAPLQVLFGGNYFALPPSKCWLVWDKLNGANDFADCELAWTNLDCAVRRIAYRWNGMIRENNEERGQHPTQKPVGVMLWTLERLKLPPGSVVFDPFCGSATTGVACLRMGLRFVGVEREAKYAAVATERLAAESNGLSLSDARAGQASLFEPSQPRLLSVTPRDQFGQSIKEEK